MVVSWTVNEVPRTYVAGDGGPGARGVEARGVEPPLVRSSASSPLVAEAQLPSPEHQAHPDASNGAPPPPRGRFPGRRRSVLAVLVVVLGIAGLTVMSMAPAGGPRSLGVFQAVVLGAVEGVTEFLPVSSTAHLAVAGRLLGVARGAEQRAILDSYLVVIQSGAIMAVAWLYRKRLAAMVWRPGSQGRHILAAVMVASAPAGVVGLAVGDVVKRRLFDPRPIALAWLVGGVAILMVARRIAGRTGRPLESIGLSAAWVVGAAQCLALWPGTSRSLVTILAGTLIGLSLAAAVELSFLVGFVTLLGASGLEAVRHGPEIIATLGWVGPLAGAAVAFVTAVGAIRGMVGLLSRRDLRPFGYYRLAAAAATAGLIAVGML